MNSSEQEPAKRSSLGKLLSERVTDFLAIVILIVIALTAGRQLSEWWNQSEPAGGTISTAGTAAQSGLPWGTDGKPVEIQFGNAVHPFQRTEIVGGSEVIQHRIIELTTKMIASSKKNAEPVSISEKKILDYLSNLLPAATTIRGERVYLVGGPTPFVWGTHTSEKEEERIACWGTCLPVSAQQWNFYLSRFGSVSRSANRNQTRQFLPKSCQTVLALQNPDGSAIISFQSEQSIEITRSSFTKMYQTEDWEIVAPWREHAEGSFSASFLKMEPKRLIRCDVQLRTDKSTDKSTSKNQKNSGLLVVTVAAR